MTLQECIDKLRSDNKLWMYNTRVNDQMSEEEKLQIAQSVLASPKQWAQRLYEQQPKLES